MTLPFGGTLQKMWLPPYYLLFRVKIDNEEYLGRVDTLRYEQHFDKPSLGYFMVYNNIEDFKNSIVSQEIKISADRVEILEIIDTYAKQHPSEINSLFKAYEDLIKIPSIPDLGTLKRIVPATLENLGNKVNDFCELHKKAKKEQIIEKIKEFKNDIKHIKDESTQIEMSMLLQELKESIYYQVDYLIRYSEHH